MTPDGWLRPLEVQLAQTRQAGELVWRLLDVGGGPRQVEGAAAKLAEQAFGHLVTRTENQNAMPHRLVTIRLPQDGATDSKRLTQADRSPNGARHHARAAWLADHGQQVGEQQADFAGGFTARRKAAMNLPAICGPTVSGSRPAA